MFFSIKNPELINVLSLKPGVCLNIATHALLTASKFFLVPFLPSPSFFFFGGGGGGGGGVSFFLCFPRLFSNLVATF